MIFVLAVNEDTNISTHTIWACCMDPKKLKVPESNLKLLKCQYELSMRSINIVYQYEIELLL